MPKKANTWAAVDAAATVEAAADAAAAEQATRAAPAATTAEAAAAAATERNKKLYARCDIAAGVKLAKESGGFQDAGHYRNYGYARLA